MSTRRKAAKKRVRATATRVTQRQVLKALANPRTGGLLGLESKFVDYHNLRGAAISFSSEFDWQVMPASAATTCLNAAAQGDTQIDRRGREAAFSSVQWRARWYFPPDVTSANMPNDVLLRVVLLVDKQPNGTLITGDQPFEPIPTDNDDIHGFYDLSDVPNRFRILKDKTFHIPNPAANYRPATADNIWGGHTGVIKLSYRFKTPLITTWEGTGADYANMVSNAIYVVGICNTTYMQFVTGSRCRFRG